MVDVPPDPVPPPGAGLDVVGVGFDVPPFEAGVSDWLLEPPPQADRRTKKKETISAGIALVCMAPVSEVDCSYPVRCVDEETVLVEAAAESRVAGESCFAQSTRRAKFAKKLIDLRVRHVLSL